MNTHHYPKAKTMLDQLAWSLFNTY